MDNKVKQSHAGESPGPKVKQGVTEYQVRPPDGGHGWVLVGAAFVVQLLSALVTGSFAMLYIEYTAVFNTTKAASGWIVSLQMFTSSIACLLSGKPVDRFGCRRVGIFGGLLAASGKLFCAFAPNIYFLYLGNGLLYGPGSGISYLCSIVIIQTWFEKKRALAASISILGLPSGIMISGPFTQYLIDVYGWRGTLMFMSGLTLQTVVMIALYRSPPKVKVGGDTELVECSSNRMNLVTSKDDDVYPEFEKEKVDQIPEQEKLLDSDIKELPSEDCQKFTNKLELEGNLPPSQSRLSQKQTPLPKSALQIIKCKLCPNISTIIDWSVMRNRVFVIFSLCTVLFMFTYQTHQMHVPSRARSKGMDMSMVRWLPSVTGLANVIGSILGGLLGTLRYWRLSLQYCVGCLAGGIITILFGFTGNIFWLNILCLVAIHSLYGGFLTIQSTLMTEIVGVHLIARAFGIFIFLLALAGLMTAPFAGWLYDISRNYDLPFFVTGGMQTLAGCILFLIPFKFQAPGETKTSLTLFQKEEM